MDFKVAVTTFGTMLSTQTAEDLARLGRDFWGGGGRPEHYS